MGLDRRGVLLAAIVVLLGGCSSSSSGGGASDSGTTGGGDSGRVGDSASGGDSTGGGDSQSGADSTGMDSGSGDGGVTGDSGSCPAVDPLKTGLIAQQTGVSVDSFDCPILQWAAAYNEPDPMIFKAIIYVESRFDYAAVACPNLPCGMPSGWTAMESGCFGLMQVVPACGGLPNNVGLLPNGHPNLTTDMTSSMWPGSIFNPENNIEVGVAGVAGNRMQVEMMFPGCTTDQYTMMAVGNYNMYGSTQSCTVYNTAYDDLVVMAYQQYSAAAGYPAHMY